MAQLKAVINPHKVVQLKTSAVAGTVSKMGDLADVELGALGDGGVLMYNSATGKFELKTDIENPNTKIIGGSF